MGRDDVTVPAATPAAAGPETGSVWARYLLVERLGAGGMGTVWAAYDPELDRKVALKVLHDEQLGRASQAQLRGEAQAMARITHPNVVVVYDVGEFRGRTYYTMELVRGQSVKDWLAAPRSWREVLRVFRDAARGLAAIHEAGVVHRDIKPGNVLLGDDGRARIADLGLAMAGEVHAGTPVYMAPEQRTGGGDARSDQFSFGVALWEALHGALPSAAGTADVPRWLDAVVRKALAEQPEDRFADTAALARALEHAPRRRWPWLVAAGVVLAIAGILITRDEDPGACRVDHELVNVWDAPAKLRINAAMMAHPGPYAGTWREVERTVDRYVEAWHAAAQAACFERVAGEAIATAGPRAACLTQRLSEIRTLGIALAQLDDTGVRTAPVMARALSPISDCADPVYLAELAALSDPARAAVRAQIAAVRIGRPDLAAARRVAVAARVIGDLQLEGEALAEVGRAEVAADQLQAAVETLARAAAIGDGKVRIDAWVRASSALQSLGRLGDAGRLLDAADAALVASPDPLREAGAASARGTLLGRQRDYLAALDRFTHAIALYDQVFGPSSTAQSATIRNLSIVLRRVGRTSDALAALQRVLELDTAAVGPDDLDVARDLHQIAVIHSSLEHYDDAAGMLERALANFGKAAKTLEVAAIEADLGIVYWRLDRPTEAIAALRAAVAIRTAAAPDAQETLDARSQLAKLVAATGGADEAERELRAILEVRRRQLGETHATVGFDALALAEALARLARFDEALALTSRAEQILVTEIGSDAPVVASVIALRADIQRRRGRPRDALQLDERAAAIRSKLDSEGERQIAALALAKDHLALGEPARARVLAEPALTYFERHGPTPRLVDARFTVARAAWAAGVREPRTLELARSARAISARLVTAAVVVPVAEIDAWLANR